MTITFKVLQIIGHKELIFAHIQLWSENVIKTFEARGQGHSADALRSQYLAN